MRILFTPFDAKDANAELALMQCCQTVTPERICLYCPDDDSAPSDQLVLSLSASYEVQIIGSPMISVSSEADDTLAALSAVLTELRRNNPDAEIYIDTLAGSDTVQNAMIDLITATDLDLVPALSAKPSDAGIPSETELEAEPEEIGTDSNGLTISSDAESDANEKPAVDSEALLKEQATKLTRDLTVKQISALIDAYDYAGALALARGSESELPVYFTDLLDAVILRSQGRLMEAQQKCRDCGQASLLPEASLTAEYYLLMDLYLKQRRYMDFLRSAPPFLIELLIAAIRTKYSMDITQYMIYGSRKWDHSKLMVGQMTGKFKESYTYHQKPKPGNLGVYVSTANLSNLIENLSVPRRDSQMMLDTLKLRLDIEEKTRSLSSFSMRGVTAQDIQTATTHTPEDLLQMMLNYARNYTDISLSDEYLQSYRTIGEKLKAMLS